MRILHVIDSLNRGGAEVMLTTMAPVFQAQGIQCDIVALIKRPSPLEQDLFDHGINLTYTGIDKLYSHRQVSALSSLLTGYDLVHVHLFPAQLWAVLAARRGSIPLLTTEHNTWNARRRWWIRPIDRWMYSRYDRIACNSEATQESLIGWCPSAAQKTTVVPNGIPLSVFENAAPASLPEVPSNVPRLVFVGRFEPQKDHATLVRALADVPDAHVIFVGDGPLRPTIEGLAQSLGVKRRITFLGWRKDVASILKASDIYVHPTHSDGFGIAACEAMAAGLPVIASDVPGLAQLVSGVGLLFPVEDSTTLAKLLTELIHNPRRQQEMKQAGIHRARQLSIENTVDRYIEMYESLLGVRQARMAE